jgi:predicted secreted protein
MPLAYQQLVPLTLDTCFHISIHSAKKLWAYFESLAHAQHLFIQQISSGRYLTLIDHQNSNNQQYLVMQISGSGAFWSFHSDENGEWRIVEGYSTGEER